MSKTVLVTGTSSGIGYGLVKELCEQGSHVIGISRRKCGLQEEFPNYSHFTADLTDYKALSNIMDKIFSLSKSFDLVVLNAGILGEIKRFENQALEDSIEVMNINVWANKFLIDQFITNEIKVKQFVAISSGAAKNGSAGWGAYSVSKAALNMLIQTYASENLDSHFSALAPGLVDTAMQDYISSIKQDERMPSIEKLQLAKGTKDMPNPIKAAAMLLDSMEEALDHQSGVFLDVRNM